MATSKFEKRFVTNTGNPLLNATIELVPQENTYPTGKLLLNEHPTRKGWYYKNAVPMGEYKIYINGSLYTENIFHAESILKSLLASFDENLKIISAGIKDGTIKLEDLSSEIRSLLQSSVTGIRYLNLYVTGALDISTYAEEIFGITAPIDNITITAINGGVDGQKITLRVSNGSYSVTIPTTANVQLSTGTDRVLTQRQAISFVYSTGSSKWFEIGNTFDQEADLESIFNSLIGSAAIAASQITDLTASRVVIVDEDGVVTTHPNVTDTELGYLAGLSSNAQQQLTALDKIRSGQSQFSGTSNSKIVSTGMTTTGYRFLAMPAVSLYNADDSLRVEVNPDTTITVRRGNSGTSNLDFFWFRIKPE